MGILNTIKTVAIPINQIVMNKRKQSQPIAPAYKDVDPYQIWDDIIDMMDDYRDSRERRNDFIERLKKNYNVSLAAALPIDKGSGDKNIFELLQEQEYTGPLSMPMPAQEFFPPTKKESVIDKGSDEYELERLVSMVCDQFDAPFDGRIAFCKKAVNDWKKGIAAEKKVVDKGPAV